VSDEIKQAAGDLNAASIKPRIDEDGVGWCDAQCPLNVPALDVVMGVLGENKVAEDCWMSFPGDVCPVHARRMAQELKFQRHINEETTTLDKLRAESAEARIAELEAQLAEARRDSERLDWLEENTDRLVDALMTKHINPNVNLRAAIDAAREEE